LSPLIRLMVLTSLLVCPAWVAASDCSSLANTRWLLGEWVAGGDKAVLHESWTELGAQTFDGIGSELSMADGKVIGSEALRLVEMAGAVFYIAKVTHNALPVAFRLTECAGDRLVFENPAHDFPRRLEYRKADGRMIVFVSDGQDEGFTLDFERRAASDDAGGGTVLAAEDARFAAMTRADAAELASWLADDLQYVHSTGQVESRDQLLHSIASGALRYLDITPHERQVVMLGNRSALVRGHGRFQVVAGGTKLDMKIRFLSVYGLDDDSRWRLRSWQSLRLPPAAAPAQADEKPDEQTYFADHSANLRELRASGNILLGGRFGDVGLILLKAGVFQAKVQTWSPFMSGCTDEGTTQL